MEKRLMCAIGIACSLAIGCSPSPRKIVPYYPPVLTLNIGSEKEFREEYNHILTMTGKSGGFTQKEYIGALGPYITPERERWLVEQLSRQRDDQKTEIIIYLIGRPQTNEATKALEKFAKSEKKNFRLLANRYLDKPSKDDSYGSGRGPGYTPPK